MITRAEAEAEVLEVAAPGLALVGVSTAAGGDGTVAGLDSALRAGFAAAGLRPAARRVTDADLAAVPDDALDLLLRAAQLAALDLVLLRWTAPDESEGQSSQKWGGLHESIRRTADRLRAELAPLRSDAPGVAVLGIGSLSLEILDPPEEACW